MARSLDPGFDAPADNLQQAFRANIHQSVAQDNQARVHLVDQADNADAQPFTHMFISLHRHRVPRAHRKGNRFIVQVARV